MSEWTLGLDTSVRQVLLDDGKQLALCADHQALAVERTVTLLEHDAVECYVCLVSSRLLGKPPLTDWRTTRECSVSNNTNIPLDFKLTRPLSQGGSVLTAHRVLPGGSYRWCYLPIEELYGPIRVVEPDGLTALIYGTDSQGRLLSATRNGIVLVSGSGSNNHLMNVQFNAFGGLTRWSA